MTQSELLQNIKIKLEKQGTKFSTYYGGTIIYASGPKPKGFFKSVNEGNYSIDVLIIPDKFLTTRVNDTVANFFLKGETND